MTAIAGGFDGEGGFPVMTGAAGVAALHLRHGKALGIFTGGKDAVVAIGTLEKSGMILVTEDGYPGLLYLELNLLGREMTAIAVPFH